MQCSTANDNFIRKTRGCLCKSVTPVLFPNSQFVMLLHVKVLMIIVCRLLVTYW